MSKKLIGLVVMMLALSYFLWLSGGMLLADPLVKLLGRMKPILDVSMAPGLILNGCDGYDCNLANDIPDPKERAKYRTKKYRSIYESWHWDKGGIVIRGTCFASYEDAVELVNYSTIAGRSINSIFNGWPDKKDIGDKTHWDNFDCVSFVKGNVLVTVDITCFSNDEDEMKAFTRKIAESVERKL